MEHECDGECALACKVHVHVMQGGGIMCVKEEQMPQFLRVSGFFWVGALTPHSQLNGVSVWINYRVS